MSVFAAALGAIFRDPNMAVGALHRAGGQPYGGTACRVIRKQPDQVSEFNQGRFVSGSDMIDIQMAEVPDLEIGDHFVIGAEVFEVVSEPMRDAQRLIWTAVLSPVASDAP